MAFFESFRAVRWIRTMNLVLQAILFLTFFAGLNWVARNHASRFDLTQYHRYSLSAETVSYIKDLPKRVTIVATVTDEEDVPAEVRGLLDEFSHASEGNARGLITHETVNIYQNRRRAESLGLEQPNVLMVISGENHRALPINELYEMKNKGGEVVRDAFIGEERLMAAILDVSNSERRRIYFLTGHGELQVDDTSPARGLSYLREELKVRNFQVETLELSVNRRVPEDASLVVAVWPQSGFSPAEQEMLRQYLTVNAGRLILLLAPGVSSIRLGLDDLLLDWGVLVYDDVIYDTDPTFRTDDGDLIIRSFLPHPVTQTLINNGWPLRFGYTRTVCPDPSRTGGGGLTTTTIAAVSPTAWGDVGYRIGLQPRFSNEGNTHPVPGLKPANQLGVVVASERIAQRGNLAFSVRAGRVVVFGSGDFVANQRIGSAGNEAVFLNAVNWAVERDHQLNVPARPIQRFQLAVSAADLNRLNYTLWFALPGVAAVLGILVYWTRRK